MAYILWRVTMHLVVKWCSLTLYYHKNEGYDDDRYKWLQLMNMISNTYIGFNNSCLIMISSPLPVLLLKNSYTFASLHRMTISHLKQPKLFYIDCNLSKYCEGWMTVKFPLSVTKLTFISTYFCCKGSNKLLLSLK